jgi:predicted DNA-binding mobile mystery protein A
MKDLKQKLIIEQLDSKLQKFVPLLKNPAPENGWINAVRTALKMSYRQLGDRLGISNNSAKNIEKREREGAITLRNLEEAGRALNMKLVYGFVPVDGSIKKTIENKAKELALEIIKTTSDTMALEDQKISNVRLKKAVEDKAKQLVYEMPRYLWD